VTFLRDQDVSDSPEPDWEAIEYWTHCGEVHGGNDCDCPDPTPEEISAARAERERQHNAETHHGRPCDCANPF
jgi:hypothetical protein